MTPLDLIAWVGAITASIVFVALALVIVVSAVKSVRGKSTARKGSATILSGGER